MVVEVPGDCHIAVGKKSNALLSEIMPGRQVTVSYAGGGKDAPVARSIIVP